MKTLKIKGNKILIILIVFVIFLILLKTQTVLGMQHYYKTDFSTGLVTATTLNARSGPGTKYPVVATAKKNEYIRVFAEIGDRYVVQVKGDYIGAVTAWMNSAGHKANILNSSFAYTGIGVVGSNKYGKIYVQMFIGK